MINNLPIYIIICLLITIILETLLALFLKVKNKKDLLNIILVNILTNPIIVFTSFIVNIYFLKFYILIIIILEIFTIFIEGLIYKKYLNYHKINPFVLSIILNLFSYITGLFINNFI